MAKPKPWPAAIIGITTGAEAPPMKRPALYSAVCAVPRISGREQLGDQGTVAADHAVGKHAHKEAADEQRRGIGELAIDDDHCSSANLERPERRTTSSLVGQEAEGRNADHHAQNRHGGPQTRRRKAQAELRVQVLGKPRHNSEIAGILNGAQNNDDDRKLSTLGVANRSLSLPWALPEALCSS